MIEDPRRYMRVANQIRAQIQEGVLKPGDCPPSITKMCLEMELSRRTAGRAMQVLENEGLLMRVKGLGYYVTDKDHASATVIEEAETEAAIAEYEAWKAAGCPGGHISHEAVTAELLLPSRREAGKERRHN
jgi:DNA-binding GntR family transcriptional regulator